MIDARRVREYLDLAREQVGPAGLEALAGAAAAKSRKLRRVLRGPIGREEAAAALAHVFPAARALRRRRAELPGSLAPAIRRLLAGSGPAGRRIDDFCQEAADLLGAAAADVAADLLHFTRPEGYWLSARWVWNPGDGTGVLSLLGQVPRAGGGLTPGEAYVAVGEELAHLRAVIGPEVEGGAGPFGLDAYLAAVFGVHSYLVASVRTTEEFAAILPRPLEVAARLLGAREWLDAAASGGASEEQAAAAAATTMSPAGEGGIR